MRAPTGALVGVAASTVASGYATVSVGGQLVTAAVARGMTLAAGDPVLIQRVGGLWVVSTLLATGTPGTIPDIDRAPETSPATTEGLLIVAPVETGSYRAGAWRTDSDVVVQGEYGGFANSTGCAFYGDKPLALDGATVTAATVRIRRERGGAFSAATATLRLVTETTKPAGAPTLTSTTTGPSLAVGVTETFTVPEAWAQEMVDGTAGGLAIYDADGNPYMVTAGTDAWGPAWAITITYTRSY